MSTYATWDQLIDRYPELSVKGGATKVNSSVIHGAERELDSRLARAFTTPFSSNNYTATDLTLELCYIRIFENKTPEKVEKKCERVDRRIENLLTGLDVMLTTSGDTISTTGGGGAVYSTTEDYHPTFGMDDIEYMSISSDQIDAEEDARDG